MFFSWLQSVLSKKSAQLASSQRVAAIAPVITTAETRKTTGAGLLATPACSCSPPGATTVDHGPGGHRGAGAGGRRVCCRGLTGLLHTKLLRCRQQQLRGETLGAAGRKPGTRNLPASLTQAACFAPKWSQLRNRATVGRHFILGAYRRAGVARTGDVRAPRPSPAPSSRGRPHTPAPPPRTAPPPLARPKTPDILGIRRMELPGNCALTKHRVT